ncbi:MAG TPA: MoaD/ThiS family protein [Gammaproteobacteria bacterium]|nr:MoaD/ThiS family protein [Gammaproteobacteria bacterium]
MQITLKLYATLTRYLPEDAENHSVTVAVTKDETPNELIDRFRVPRELAHLVLLNGVYLPPADRDDQSLLKEGDTLAVWPPVAGG